VRRRRNHKATEHWNAVLARHPSDIVAMKLAHEAYFLVGDSNSMLESMSRSMRDWRPDMTGHGFVLGQYAFALEECRRYAAAEGPAILALDQERDDCWALHALIHVYEMQNRHADCLSLLDALKPHWTNQPLLLAHVWWHLALRYIAAHRYDEALAIYDNELAKVDVLSAFRLTDGTSLLWRLELAVYVDIESSPALNAKVLINGALVLLEKAPSIEAMVHWLMSAIRGA
jgi:tetratricopeptide (TPR) repeat protein